VLFIVSFHVSTGDLLLGRGRGAGRAATCFSARQNSVLRKRAADCFFARQRTATPPADRFADLHSTFYSSTGDLLLGRGRGANRAAQRLKVTNVTKLTNFFVSFWHLFRFGNPRLTGS
jgi:hypothetical protein